MGSEEPQSLKATHQQGKGGGQQQKYNKWFINSNHRFMKEIDLNKQPGIKVFNPANFKSTEQLTKSGFIPYFKFGKYSKYDIKEDPSLKETMAKYHTIQE